MIKKGELNEELKRAIPIDGMTVMLLKNISVIHSF